MLTMLTLCRQCETSTSTAVMFVRALKKKYSVIPLTHSRRSSLIFEALRSIDRAHEADWLAAWVTLPSSLPVNLRTQRCSFDEVSVTTDAATRQHAPSVSAKQLLHLLASYKAGTRPVGSEVVWVSVGQRWEQQRVIQRRKNTTWRKPSFRQ